MFTNPIETMFSDDLLNEFLLAFGFEKAPNKELTDEKVRRALSGLPEDTEARARNYRKELTEAKPVLQKLIARLRYIRQQPLLQPRNYQLVWRGLIEEWNNTISERGWLSLPPLCYHCGVPVFLRAPERQAAGGMKLSMVCSEPCRNAHKSLRFARRAR